MKIRYSVLDFSKESDLLEDAPLKFIVEYKEHWWNKWKYIMDRNGIPELFDYTENVKKMFDSQNIKRKYE